MPRPGPCCRSRAPGQRCRCASRSFGSLILLPLVLWLPAELMASSRLHAAPPLPPDSTAGAMAGSDRLAEPALPETPTQTELGHNLYYFHCMPCHGDQGQGLTDEWRAVWVEDHRNCWARGCHTGKSELTAFFIPRAIPPVIGGPESLSSFQSPEELFAYLRGTQPPQRPGALSEAEYWALAAYLLDENGRLAPGQRLSPSIRGDLIAVASLGLVVALLIVPRLGHGQLNRGSARRAARQQIDASAG